MTGDKTCDCITEIALIIGVVESVPCLLIGPRLCRKLLGTKGRFNGSGYGLLLERIVLPDMYAIACKVLLSIRYDALLIVATIVEPSVARGYTRQLI